MTQPVLSSLLGLTLSEAKAYIAAAKGDEVIAAFDLACDRNHLEGIDREPDPAEVHHALFLLYKARGEQVPSFDQMRLSLRRLQAA
jgi:hypothetical protein